ncbi:MAG: site-specific DNA-methyltransferase [Chloroflexota bacterium]|nr:site-specific DNA-methyltransferase [Chloroflexota bacterium]
MTTTILTGDCRDHMRQMEPESIDAIVTDPPAGINFMQKEWDHHKGGREQWIAWMAGVMRECHRVLKPGGHALVWALPRTSHWTATAVEDAGFEIRDVVMHLFGSGFPKSASVSKMIDKAAGADARFAPAAQQWEGWGTALKPAAEHWILARKPLGGGHTVAANVLEYGTGGLNIDGCRIGTTKDVPASPNGTTGVHGIYGGGFQAMQERSGMDPNVGRWPPNVALSCCGNDPHDPDCAAAMLDAQSGTLTSGKPNGMRNKVSPTFPHPTGTGVPLTGYGDTGGASRFFYCAKASRAERNAGLEGMEERAAGVHDDDSYVWPKNGDGSPRNKKVQPRANFHPCVKPLSLMSWLVRMVTPPGGVVLDPFMGSGSTGVAAIHEGFNFIGIDLDPDYCEIARKRIDHVQRQAKQNPLW